MSRTAVALRYVVSVGCALSIYALLALFPWAAVEWSWDLSPYHIVAHAALIGVGSVATASLIREPAHKINAWMILSFYMLMVVLWLGTSLIARLMS